MNTVCCLPAAILILASASTPALAGADDCDQCPEMVSIPAGSFAFGSPQDEAGHQEDEAPQRTLEMPSFAISRFEITIGEYRRFVADTGHTPEFGCITMQESGAWSYDPEGSWEAPGFEQDDEHPVTCITWNDAVAYTAWLSSLDPGNSYRLPSETEWEYAARAGAATRHWWGGEEGEFCAYTNGVDASARAVYPGWELAGDCDDGFVYTAPVGHYARPNSFGVEDMVGNVWEWVADCYTATHADNPGDGTPLDLDPCEKRVMRGGAWGDYGSFYLRTAYRGAWDGSQAFANIGFRVARSAE